MTTTEDFHSLEPVKTIQTVSGEDLQRDRQVLSINKVKDVMLTDENTRKEIMDNLMSGEKRELLKTAIALFGISEHSVKNSTKIKEGRLITKRVFRTIEFIDGNVSLLKGNIHGNAHAFYRLANAFISIVTHATVELYNARYLAKYPDAGGFFGPEGAPTTMADVTLDTGVKISVRGVPADLVKQRAHYTKQSERAQFAEELKEVVLETPELADCPAVYLKGFALTDENLGLVSAELCEDIESTQMEKSASEYEFLIKLGETEKGVVKRTTSNRNLLDLPLARKSFFSQIDTSLRLQAERRMQAIAGDNGVKVGSKRDYFLVRDRATLDTIFAKIEADIEEFKATNKSNVQKAKEDNEAELKAKDDEVLKMQMVAEVAKKEAEEANLAMIAKDKQHEEEMVANVKRMEEAMVAKAATEKRAKDDAIEQKHEMVLVRSSSRHDLMQKDVVHLEERYRMSLDLEKAVHRLSLSDSEEKGKTAVAEEKLKTAEEKVKTAEEKVKTAVAEEKLKSAVAEEKAKYALLNAENKIALVESNHRAEIAEMELKHLREIKRVRVGDNTMA